MPIKILTLIALSLSLLLSSGCGPSVKKDSLSHKDTSRAHILKNSGRVKRSLYLQHKKWQGVKYQFGGLSKQGIDCSGFVYLTFKSQFKIDLPRTTKKQAKIGKKIKKRKLRAGDLVFFKTSPRVRHVGIYIEKGKFVHASTNSGVIVSRLDNVYWKSRYWKARRVK